MLELQTLLSGATVSRRQITFKVSDTVGVRVDDTTVERLELRRHDLEEILEHILRFRRLRIPSVRYLPHNQHVHGNLPLRYANREDSGRYQGSRAWPC